MTIGIEAPQATTSENVQRLAGEQGKALIKRRFTQSSRFHPENAGCYGDRRRSGWETGKGGRRLETRMLGDFPGFILCDEPGMAIIAGISESRVKYGQYSEE
jgi:hypothetical protein